MFHVCDDTLHFQRLRFPTLWSCLSNSMHPTPSHLSSCMHASNLDVWPLLHLLVMATPLHVVVWNLFMKLHTGFFSKVVQPDVRCSRVELARDRAREPHDRRVGATGAVGWCEPGVRGGGNTGRSRSGCHVAAGGPGTRGTGPRATWRRRDGCRRRRCGTACVEGRMEARRLDRVEKRREEGDKGRQKSCREPRKTWPWPT